MSNEANNEVDLYFAVQTIATKLNDRAEQAQKFIEANLPERGHSPSPMAMASMLEMADAVGGLKAIRELGEHLRAQSEGKITPPEPEIEFTDDDITQEAKDKVINMLDRFKANGKPN